MILGELIVKIQADLSNVKTELGKFKKDLNDAKQEASKSADGVSDALKSIKTALVSIGIAKYAVEFVKFSGTVDTVSTAFSNLASNAQGGSRGLLAAMQEATKGTVDNLEIMKSSNLALQLMGEDVAARLPEMAKIATAAARAQGVSVKQMLNDIVVATGRQSVMILDNLGISSATASKEIEKYAASLGKTRDQLSETEKKQAFFNAVMVAGNEIVAKTGAKGATLGESLQQMGAAFSNLGITLTQLFDFKGLIEGITSFIKWLDSLKIKWLEFAAFLAEMNAKFEKYLGTQQSYAQALRVQIQVLTDLRRAQGLLNEEQNKPKKKTGGIATPDPKAMEALSKINEDYYNKQLQLDKDTIGLILSQESKAIEDLSATKLQGTTEYELARTNITKYYADQRAAYEKQKALEVANTAINAMSQMTSGLSGIFSQYMTNKNIELDNDLYNGQQRIQTEYDAEKQRIESTVVDEREKAAQLKALDEKKARDDEALQKKIEKAKRKAAREAAAYEKAIAITNAIVNTARGVTAALGMFPPPVAWAMAAINAALGAAQVALIAQQPLPAAAKGGVFDTPYIGGEAGQEMAVPLEGANGQSAIRAMASGMLDVMSQAVDNRATISNNASVASGGGGNVYLDGELVGKWLQNGSNNGLFYINQKVVIA